MANMDDMVQKAKGKLQQTKGDLQQKTSPEDDMGAKVKGGVSKAKGMFNEKVADMKHDADKKKDKEDIAREEEMNEEREEE